jgi:hypothetical protein
MVLVRYRSPILYLAFSGVYHHFKRKALTVLFLKVGLQFQATLLFLANPRSECRRLISSGGVLNGNITLSVPTFQSLFSSLHPILDLSS